MLKTNGFRKFSILKHYEIDFDALTLQTETKTTPSHLTRCPFLLKGKVREGTFYETERQHINKSGVSDYVNTLGHQPCSLRP